MVLPSRLHDQFSSRRRSSAGLSSTGMSSLGRPIISSAAFNDGTATGGVVEAIDEMELDAGDTEAPESSIATPHAEIGSTGFPFNLTPSLSPPLNLANRRPQPSGIALQLARARANRPSPNITVRSPTGDEPSDLDLLEDQRQITSPQDPYPNVDSQIPDEATALLSPSSRTTHRPLIYPNAQNYGSVPSKPPPSQTLSTRIRSSFAQTRKLRQKELWKNVTASIASSIPAVIIGLLLNILDGVSCEYLRFYR
jgi:hypothetical protein